MLPSRLSACPAALARLGGLEEAEHGVVGVHLPRVELAAAHALARRRRLYAPQLHRVTQEVRLGREPARAAALSITRVRGDAAAVWRRAGGREQETAR